MRELRKAVTDLKNVVEGTVRNGSIN